MIADYSVKVWRIIGSPRYPAPEQRLRDEAIQGYERCYYPWGTARHFSAILASGSLAHYDRQITAPTVVLHGKADKLQRPFGGRVVARTIPGARLRVVRRHGPRPARRTVGRRHRRADHDVYRGLRDSFADSV